MPKWIKINAWGCFCGICGAAVIMSSPGLICTNQYCEKHYDEPVTQSMGFASNGNQMLFSSNATTTSSDISNSYISTTTTLLE